MERNFETVMIEQCAPVLAGLKPAEKLVGIAAHISCVDFVYYDLALRVHNEASALCKAVFLDIHLKVAAQRMCGVGQHGIADFSDALGGVMPRLVDEVLSLIHI